ncbi:hypothetical protein TWF694_008248 [Orbilia ellipsospora]|uniref:IucC family-domain-containing protein n=1 Tax=Orbilia ellipsospora TaxID=2528407 RepID=A0AAV9XFI4_9PEZI
MEYAASRPLLTLQSSFIDWENAVILGHPTYPFHRNCVPDKALAPLPPSELHRLTNPTVAILLVPRSDICVYGEIENLLEPLLESFGTSSSAPAGHIYIPYLAEQVPAILEAFPLARVIKSVPDRSRSQSSLRTVTITDYKLDLKFSVAYRIGSQYRQFGRPSVSVGLGWAKILRKIVPENLWLFDELAGVAGDDQKMDYHSSCRLACVLRENSTARADVNDEALIVWAALMEKPYCDDRTYAEILFHLDTKGKKVEWFTSYIKCLMELVLHPLLHYGVALEAHAQNMIARFSRSTGDITGFAYRDMGGVRGHAPTLQKLGLLTESINPTCKDDMAYFLDRLHQTLIQNIGYLLYTLGLEDIDNGTDVWGIVRFVLSDTLDADNNIFGGQVYKHLTEQKMPLNCYLGRRMASSFRSRPTQGAEHLKREVPNHIAGTSA